jgi:hypothetical protein
MSVYQEQVRERFHGLESDDLLQRVNNGTLTTEAHAAAIAELASRGVSTTELPTAPPEGGNKVEPGFFVRCFRGNEKLWKAYWLLGLVGVLLAIPLRILALNGSIGAALLFVLFISVPFQIFWSVSVWRCAFRSSHWFWAILARAIVLLSAIYLLAAWGPVAMLWARG